VIQLCGDACALEVTLLQLSLLYARILSMSGDAREMLFEIPFLTIIELLLYFTTIEPPWSIQVQIKRYPLKKKNDTPLTAGLWTISLWNRPYIYIY